MKMRCTIMLSLMCVISSIFAMEEKGVIKKKKSKRDNIELIAGESILSNKNKKSRTATKSAVAPASSSQPNAKLNQIQTDVNAAISVFNSIDTTLGDVLLPLKPQLDAIKTFIDAAGAGVGTMAPLLAGLLQKIQQFEPIITTLQSDVAMMKQDFAPLLTKITQRLTTLEAKLAEDTKEAGQEITSCLCSKKAKKTTSSIAPVAHPAVQAQAAQKK